MLQSWLTVIGNALMLQYWCEKYTKIKSSMKISVRVKEKDPSQGKGTTKA